ncbi:MAG: PLDc N-terminal domain-containing protein [Candidatus Omnitrophota bacterium]
METLIFGLIVVIDVVAIVDLLKLRTSLVKKILWAVVILSVPAIGAVLYFLLGRPDAQAA